jgi:hypothetical protein
VRTAVGDAGIRALLDRPPAVTRYEAGRRPATGRARPRAAVAWAGASVVLATAGIGAVLLLPSDTGPSARVDVSVAAGTVPAATTPVPPAPPTGQVGAAAGPGEPAEPVSVRIPALGMTSPVMELGLERDGSMEVPPGAYPVGWYHGSAPPGQQGAAVLAGHVDWEGEPGAFYGLRELVGGDTVVVERSDGTVATFLVDRVEEHLKDDFPSAAVYGRIDHAGLRLITCGGAFDEDTGDYQANVVVFAHLTATV